MYNDHFGNYLKYVKDYVANMKGVISQRKMVYEEYTRAKMTLNEKKNSQLIMDKSKWELDEKYAKSIGIHLEDVKTDPILARKIMFKDVA